MIGVITTLCRFPTSPTQQSKKLSKISLARGMLQNTPALFCGLSASQACADRPQLYHGVSLTGRAQWSR